MRLAGRLAVATAFATLVTAARVPAKADTAAPAAVDDAAMASALSRRYTQLFQKYRSAVVRVNATSNEDGSEQSKFWTGFFINHDGYVLTTNAKELQNTVRISVETDDFRSYAEVKGVDLETNIALLHVIFPPKQYEAVDIFNGTETTDIGTMLMAITCKPFQPPGPSAGMVQGYNTTYVTIPLRTQHLRVNIPDDGGEGGSPVFDLQGRFAGMMMFQLTQLRSTLVMPARAVDRLVEDLMKNGKVAYGRMGIVAEPINDGAAGQRLQITTVEYDGTARAAGLKVDDVLLSIGGNSIRSHDDMRQAAFFSRPGQTIQVRVRRNGQEMELPLTVSEMPSTVAIIRSQPPPAPATANGQAGNQTAAAGANAALPALPGGVTTANPETLPPPPPVEIKPRQQ